jgi:hypothetical protein
VSITGTPPAPRITLELPVLAGNVFSFSYQSQAGLSHVAKYAADIAATSWTSLVTNMGDGLRQTVSHTNPPPGQLFYRIESSVP